MGKCGKRAFENGGNISKADQLIAEMNAKYGVSGNAPVPAPVVQQPAPQPPQQPVQQPQQRGLVGNALGILKGRSQQIDKASGYANGGRPGGGIISGPGTATSDSIPAKVKETGEHIDVSNTERIVSHEQDKLLQRLAKAMGFESVDAFFEAGTGKPVGPTIKGGKIAAANGFDIVPYDEAKDPSRAFTRPGIDSQKIARPTPLLSAPQPGTAVIPDTRPNWIPGGNPPPVDTSGFDNEVRNRATANRTNPIDYSKPMGNQAPPMPQQKTGIISTLKAAKPYANAAMTGAAVVGNIATAMGSDDPAVQGAEAIKAGLTAFPPTRAIGYGLQVADPLAKAVTGYGLADGIDKLASFHPDYMRERRSAPPASGTQQQGEQSANPTTSVTDSNYGNEGRSVPSPITKQNPGAVVDNEFTQGGKNYTVNPTSQDGIKRVTGGTSPLYTNIDPAQGVAGLKNQMIGGDAAAVNEGLARHANANAITQSLIDAQPTGGIAVLPDYAAQQSNPMMDKFNSLAEEAKKSGRGGQRILAEFGNLVRQQMGNDASRYGADVSAQRAAGHDQILMRGQDLNAQNELARLQGNPLDQQAKQFELKQKGIIAGLFEKANAGDKDALAKYNALTNGGKEPNYSNRYITLPNRKIYNDMGQVTGEEPGGVFDAQTGHPVNFGKQPAASAPAGYKLVGTSGGRPVYEDAKGNRFVDGGK